MKVTAETITDEQIRVLRDSFDETDDPDLALACDRALGLDSLDDCDEDERIGIIDTSRDRCAAAWNARHVVGSDTITLSIPADLAESVALAIEARANWFRSDDGHDPDAIVSLQVFARRLDALAESLWEKVGIRDARHHNASKEATDG